jgi:peptide deformylase
MKETMIAANGAGLAAPQIGSDVQLVIFWYGPNLVPRFCGMLRPFHPPS